MFVRPPADCRGDPEFSHRRLVVTRDGERDVMKLMAEAAAASEALCKEIAASFGGNKTRRPCGIGRKSPPNDGKVITDGRGP